MAPSPATFVTAYLTLKQTTRVTAKVRNTRGASRDSPTFSVVLGSSHLEKLKQHGVSQATKQPIPPSDQPGYKYCETCSLHISPNFWASHSRGQRHALRSKFFNHQSVLERSEQNKEGLQVSESPSFDIIEPALAKAGVTKSIVVTNTSKTSSICLAGARFSSVGKKGTSPFSTSASNQDIPYGNPLTIHITFRQTNGGVYEDRAELIFEDIKTKKRFTISRPLSAVVGPKDELAQLEPTEPYVPLKNRRPVVQSEIVDGVRPEPLKIIPYIGRLPPALIPKPLSVALSTGSREDIINRIRETYLPDELDATNYSSNFKNLLWIEEYRQKQDMDMFDILNATLTPRRPYFDIKVPGLAEKRPSVLVGDTILVQESSAPDGKWWRGPVHEVTLDTVSLRFGSGFKHKPGTTYHVRFEMNRCPLRRQHMALGQKPDIEHITFPADSTLATASSSQLDLDFKNQLIATNPAQARAVRSIASLPPGAAPFIVFGPPGTGKTVTIVEAIRQVLIHDPDAHVLACAPSNSAADLIALRLLDLGPDVLFRLYAPSRFKSQVPEALLPYTRRTPNDRHFGVPTCEAVANFKVIVSTCISASILSGIGIKQGHYRYIFIDEAGHATEPETMVSIRTLSDKNTNVVLSGDPKQLGPIIRSAIAQEFKLTVSFIERLMDHFPNHRFYAGELEACGDASVIGAYIGSSLLPAPRFPIVFHAISGKDDREASSPSFFNIHEALQVKTYVEALKADPQRPITDDEIGIIAPYRGQVTKIRKALKSLDSTVKVGSVEEFQGQERKAIIVSTVRSSSDFLEYDLRHTLGFVANPRRFNVAVTRAKALLIVVGDPAVLSLDPLWRNFLNYVHLNNGWKGPPPTWDTSEPVDEAGRYDEQVRQTVLDEMSSFAERIGEPVDSNVDELEAGVDKPWAASSD
ncbi:hypothetical protein ONZ45_g14054 [Pleurotus djamor]|nr:hypothetical protein ONZ45_g14054 [Pleurotus djamor]